MSAGTTVPLPLPVDSLPRPNAKYLAADAALGPPSPREPRVIFFGSSAVEGWPLDQVFPGQGYLNRGIGGEQTRQMIARFDQDVMTLHPGVVVIHLGGVNDLGVFTLAETEANLTYMVRRVRATGAVPVLLSPTPSHSAGGYDHPAHRPPAQVLALRDWIADHARAERYLFVDVYPLVAASDGSLRRDLSRDGLHLTRPGYDLLTPSVSEAVQRAIHASKVK